MNKLTRRHFWEWFKRHNREYLDLKNKRKKEAAYWLNELDTHLRANSRALNFNITVCDQGASTLTITVLGKAAHFKKADALVAIAPEIPGWTITALEGPGTAGYELEEQLSATGIDVSDLYFSFPGDDRDDNGIIVYHLLCTGENERAFYSIASAVIYNLLGERSFGLDIGYLQVANLSQANGSDIRKLEELPACLGLRPSSWVVTEGGMLSGL